MPTADAVLAISAVVSKSVTVAMPLPASRSGPPIYFYEVPSCARDEPRSRVMDVADGRHVSDAHRVHLQGMLRQMLAIESHLQQWHRVDDPKEASLFYIPAYFPLLFWLDHAATSHDESEAGLSCVKEAFAYIERLPFLAKSSGYDHLIVYGYEYPHWRRLDHLVLDNYSPFAANMLVLTVSFWSQGRRAAIQDAGLYSLLRMIVVPYFSSWDCGSEETLLQGERDIDVAFAGSVKNDPPSFVFRERVYVAGAAKRPEFIGKLNLFLEFFPANQASRAYFARDYADKRNNLYSRSHFCLVMPGDGNTAGRIFDAMVFGCVPVLLFHPDSYPVLPFTSHLPWAEFTLMEHIANEDDAAQMLTRLLSTPPKERDALRRKTIATAPLIAMELKRCAPEVPSAMSLISAELRSRTQLLENTMLPSIMTAPPPTDPNRWFHWGGA